MNKTLKFYQELAKVVNGYHMTDSTEIKANQEKLIHELEVFLPVKEFFIERKVDIQRSTGQRLVLLVRYKHQPEYKCHNSTTGHQVIITPCLMHGFLIRVTGPDRRGAKEKIERCFSNFMP